MRLIPTQTKIALFPSTNESFLPDQILEDELFLHENVCEIGISGATGYYVLIEFDDPPTQKILDKVVNQINFIIRSSE